LPDAHPFKSNMKRLLFAFIGLFYAIGTFAQKEDFNNCAAAFLDQKMIVDDYSPEGKCVVSSGAHGTLTVRPVTINAGEAPVPGEKIKFKVALRGSGDRALMLLSEKTYNEVDIQDILKQCQKGDRIVLLTLEREWALPHHEILIE